MPSNDPLPSIPLIPLVAAERPLGCAFVAFPSALVSV